MDAQLKILGPEFSTFVRSVMIACEEKGLNYRYGMKVNDQQVKLGDETHLKYHPYGKIPVLILEDGRSICETAAIIRFIDNEYPGYELFPTDLFARAQVDQWANLIGIYIDQAFVRKFLLEFLFPKGEDGSVRMDKVEAAIPEVNRAIATLTKQLDGQDYMCGDQFSAADIMLAPMLDYLARHPKGAELLAEEVKLLAYLERVRQRPSCQKVLI